MFTPRTPALKIYRLSLVLVLTTPILGKAQEVTLHPLSIYELSLRDYHAQKLNVAAQEFEALVKRKWWYYLPQVGFTFGLPSINFGTSTLVEIDAQNERNKVKLGSIKSQALLEYRNELHQLRSMYMAVQIESNALAELNTSWNTQEMIFQIAKEAHQKKEITPGEFYQALLTYQRELSAAEARRNAFALKVIELAQFAKYNFPNGALLPSKVHE